MSYPVVRQFVILLSATTLAACSGGNHSGTIKISGKNNVADPLSAKMMKDGCLNLPAIVEEFKKQDVSVRMYTDGLSLFNPGPDLNKTKTSPIKDDLKLAQLLSKKDLKLSYEWTKLKDLRTELLAVVSQSGCDTVTFNVGGKNVVYTIEKQLKRAQQAPEEQRPDIPVRPSNNKSNATPTRPRTVFIAPQPLKMLVLRAENSYRVYQKETNQPLRIETFDLAPSTLCGAPLNAVMNARYVVQFGPQDLLKTRLKISNSIANIFVMYAGINEKAITVVPPASAASASPVNGKTKPIPTAPPKPTGEVYERSYEAAVAVITSGKMINVPCEAVKATN